MLNPWVSFGMKACQIGLEAQTVIALRMIRLATGGARAEAEASRMVTEKMMASSGLRKCRDSRMRGDEDHVVAGKMLKVYRKRVRANRRRLSRK
jgi:hypothetical protein